VRSEANTNGRRADVAIWGRVPPPIGGMAVHVARLLPLLERAGLRVHMYSLLQAGPPHPQVTDASRRRLFWYLNLLAGRGERLHYVLGGRASTRFAAGLLAATGRARVVLRVGGESLRKTGVEGGVLQRWMTRFAVRHASAIIGVNPEICELARRLGARPERVHHVPGFIAPRDDGRRPPMAVERFARDHSPVLVSGGQIPAVGEPDLYGVGLLLEMMARLRESYPRAGLVFYAYQVRTRSEEPYQRLSEDVARRGLGDCVYVHPSEGEFWPVLKLADLMVRPTTTDGDSTAVREALHLRVPVVASDCAPRPEGVVVFRSGDDGGLLAAVGQVLRELPRRPADLGSTAEEEDNGARIVEVFRELRG
jgi:glycosyltransferase involved in cell wall biosynthesis